MSSVLTTAPEKLKIKAGDIKVPIIKELSRVLRMAISRA
jgi:hypothetical protein